MALQGAMPKRLDGRAKKYLLNILIRVALKCITIGLLKPDPPTYNTLIQKVWDVYQMEQITDPLRHQKATFAKRWSPVMALLIQ